jgi:CheY-like chemotaxis protein
MKDYRPVLLIEDDSIDAKTITRAFAELKIHNKLVHVTNGEEALNYLRNSRNKKPCVIILDLSMPKMDGVEFLRTVKPDENLKQIPVVVLTASSQEQDVADSFNLGVAGYITKPANYEGFVEKLKTIQLYWSLSELPV